MNPRFVVGLVALALGIVLLIIGATASDSFADQISRTFSGHFTDRTTWYLLGGVALTLVGAVTLLTTARANKA